MDTLQPFISQLYTVFLQNREVFYFIAIALLRLLAIKSWPDRASRTFLSAGLRASSQKVDDLRMVLLNITSDTTQRVLKTTANQRIKIEEFRNERKRVKHLVEAAPILVKDVGQALQSIEREYEQQLKLIKSHQSKEVLRLAAEKGVNDVLSALSKEPLSTPFNIEE